MSLGSLIADFQGTPEYRPWISMQVFKVRASTNLMTYYAKMLVNGTPDPESKVSVANRATQAVQ